MSPKPRKNKKAAQPKAKPADLPNPTPAAQADWKPRYADDAIVKKHMEKVFRVHGDVLRRLAEYDRNG